MTEDRDRPTARRKVAWEDRSLLPDRVGVPWWVAVALALGLTAAGVFADLQRLDRLGVLFQACYFIGCLLAVSLVQRRGLFGPMVQPPLLLAVAVPGVVLIAGSQPSEPGIAAAMLAVSTPLINGFPTMAITTGITLAIGIFRLLTQRPLAMPPGSATTSAVATPSRAKPTGAKPTGAKSVRPKTNPPTPSARTTPSGRRAAPDRPAPARNDDEAITSPINRVGGEYRYP